MTNQIEFSQPGKWVMRITADRRIEVNEDVTLTEAAQTVLEAVQKLLEQQAEPVTCTWTPEDDDTMPGTFSSACGELWSFIDGGWQDNHVRFCHGCGGKVVEAKLKETR